LNHNKISTIYKHFNISLISHAEPINSLTKTKTLFGISNSRKHTSTFYSPLSSIIQHPLDPEFALSTSFFCKTALMKHINCSSNWMIMTKMTIVCNLITSNVLLICIKDIHPLPKLGKLLSSTVNIQSSHGKNCLRRLMTLWRNMTQKRLQRKWRSSSRQKLLRVLIWKSQCHHKPKYMFTFST
jgi:hypothetical protein